MKDEMLQKIKEHLLEELIDKMSSGDDRMKPKGLGVAVQAPDKEHLTEGLDKAKDLLAHGGEGDSEEPPEDDEERMLQLLDDDDEERDKY